MRSKRESNLQKLCVKWFRLQYPQYIIFAIPNGGSRHLLEAKNMKDEGVLAGVPDLQIISDNNTFFIEMKSAKGKQSEFQKIFENKVKRLGQSYFVCNSFAKFQEIIKTNI